ncbi:MAG: hypothetical protein HOY78_02220 [Saccharothrix sp.]|nr:hypothetical protein [Saccharothrix sp.]
MSEDGRVADAAELHTAGMNALRMMEEALAGLHGDEGSPRLAASHARQAEVYFAASRSAALLVIATNVIDPLPHVGGDPDTVTSWLTAAGVHPRDVAEDGRG